MWLNPIEIFSNSKKQFTWTVFAFFRNFNCFMLYSENLTCSQAIGKPVMGMDVPMKVCEWVPIVENKKKKIYLSSDHPSPMPRDDLCY